MGLSRLGALQLLVQGVVKALGVPPMGRGLPWKWERGEGEGTAASSRGSLVLCALINPRVRSCLMSPPPLLPMGKPSSFCSPPQGRCPWR